MTETKEDKFKKAEALANENYDKYLRVLAEFENYKKRAAKEQADHLQYSHERILKESLKVLDDFDRIMEHLPAEETLAVKGLIEGIQLVHRDFLKVLTKFGLKELETQNKIFDPHLHEAIGHRETEEHPEGTIVECHRKGYQFHDRLLRAATVTVAKAKSAETKPNENK